MAHSGYGRVALGLAKWLLVPAAIFGVLCVLPNLLLVALHEDDKGDRAALDIGIIHHALNAYRAKSGAWPPEDRWAAALIDAGILEREPTDPWGHPYEFRLNGGVAPVVTSVGRDGELGTDDDVDPRGATSSR